MTQSRHDRLRELFEQSYELSQEEQSAFLRSLHEQDKSIAAELEELLGFDRSAPEELHRSETPKRIGKYRIVREIDQGGMGIVFEAVEDKTEHRVALKTVLRTDQASLVRFQFEAATLETLNHPGIARVLSNATYERNGRRTPFFVMEFVEGESLSEFSANLSIRKRVRLLIQVCAAIQYAHDRGVIHRDIKPENVLVTDSGQVKVIDFGLAKAIHQDSLLVRTLSGQIMGSARYMSPEQAAGEKDKHTIQTDVYSLGMLAYHILAGTTPTLELTNPLDAFRAIQSSEEWPLASKYSLDCRGDLEAILSKSIRKRPRERYLSVRALENDLRSFSKGEQVSASTPPFFQRLRRFIGRHKAAAAGVFAVFVALATGAGLATWRLCSQSIHTDTSTRDRGRPSAGGCRVSRRQCANSGSERIVGKSHYNL